MKIFCILMFFCSGSFAYTSEQVLKTAWSDKTYLSYDKIQSTGSRNPLRNVEGVLSQEQNGTAEVEVGLKFQFKSWPEWTGKRGQGNEQKLLKETSLGWALRSRYNTLLLVELNSQKLKCVEEALHLSELYIQAQSLSLRAGRGTSKSFLSAKSDLYKLQRTQNALRQEKEILEKRVKTWAPEIKDRGLVGLELVQVDDISQLLQGHYPNGDSLSRKIANEEIEQMGQELEIVKGREKQWFKAVEVSQTRKDDETRYKVELTVQIPGLGSDDLAKQKQNELILKRALKQRDLEESGDQLQSLKVQILNLVDIYRKTKKMEKISVGTLDSLANIERKITQQQEQLDLLNQQQEITSLYLDYLLESEILLKAPDKNYLDKRQGEI
ncbi:hypothetical protein [Bdellovibrio bacteriovorus]|uniref:hypothetical protein n=1 Tax=Bdellovibrio bacteriovorus TaxID=959 RepID=UPI0035A85A35